MKGLEMMLANLLGMKPEEMRAKVETAVNLMEQGAHTAKAIEADLKAIKSHLGITDNQEETINGGTAIAKRGSGSANRNHIQL
jgi:hypothetical protein